MRDPGSVVAHVEIDAVERGSRHLEHGFAGGWGRIGEVSPTDAFGSAPLQNCRFHDASPFRPARRTFRCLNTRLSYALNVRTFLSTVSVSAGRRSPRIQAQMEGLFAVAVLHKTSTLANEKAVKRHDLTSWR